jgi:hypothetical protein
MKTISFLLKLVPCVIPLAAGAYFIAEVFFPALRDPNFNQWEINEGGSSVEVMGWRKVLTPPRVVAQGYMSNRAACAVAIAAGLILISVGVFVTRHVTGYPRFIPDIVRTWTFN